MLDPDYLDRAGDMVAGVYSQIESEMLAFLCGLLLDQDATELGQRGATALNLLAQSAAPQLMAIVEGHRAEIGEAVAATVEDALSRSDAADAAAIGAAAAEALRTLPRQVELTARGIAAILERDNVAMEQGALGLWQRCVAEAVTKVNTGAETAERAIHGAVRRMMREGVSTVTYRDPTTGEQTVTNRVDVAVRRHVRTQIAQDGMRRTLDICGQAGIRLVEVSSHGGARPEHARWQGRVYSLDGEAEVDGVRYGDFYEETGYGKVDGLGGANCRHSFGPWLPGTPRMYQPNPGHPSGLPNEEVYRLTQRQRDRERGIRRTKRELAGAQLIADRDASLANVAEVERLKAKLRRQQEGMRAFIADANRKGKAPVLQRSPNREWQGDMPRIRRTDASRRTVAEFLEGDGVKRTLKARGVSKTAAQKALSAELKAQGLDGRSWRNLSRANQQGLFKRAVSRIAGGRLGRLEDLAELDGPDNMFHALRMANPKHKSGARYRDNCQRCIAAYDLRRRGYDVEALPTPILSDVVRDDLAYMDKGGWPEMWEGAIPVEIVGADGEAVRRSIEREMESFGDGARAVVRVQWNERDYGHVFIAEQRDGMTVFVDPQSNDPAYEGWEHAISSSGNYLMRIDDKEFTDLVLEAVRNSEVAGK